MRRKSLAFMALAVALGGCGDPATTDDRGYTKAPLENPDVLIGGEEATAMSELGDPQLPQAPVLHAPGTEEGAGGGDEAPVTLAEGVTQEQFDEGRALFTGQGGCQACHGPNGGGTQLAPNLTDAEWLHVSGPSPSELASLITQGVSQPMQYPAPMPPMGGANLTEEQVQALAAYVASIGQG